MNQTLNPMIKKTNYPVTVSVLAGGPKEAEKIGEQLTIVGQNVPLNKLQKLANMIEKNPAVVDTALKYAKFV